MVRWEATVNKNASEWIAAGYDQEENEIIEHRRSKGMPRGNYWSHSLLEFDQMSSGSPSALSTLGLRSATPDPQ